MSDLYDLWLGWLCCPTDSDFSAEWGRFSMAMLVEELRKAGVNVKF